jgi:dihydrofolate reductase
MRTIVNSTFVSLDGVVNHMEKWHFDFVDEESDALARDQIDAASAMLMGRRTYEAYASVWPTRHDAYADRINAIPKYVVSATLDKADWSGTTIVRDPREVVDGDGGPVLMHGFGPVAKGLLAASRLDELHLWVHPVFAGAGGPDDTLLTQGLNVALDHTGSQTFGSGVVVLSYRRTTTV